MNCNLFSQIPSVVLKKISPNDFTEPTQKKVKFAKDIVEETIIEDPEEVTSSFCRSPSQESGAKSPCDETESIASRTSSPSKGSPSFFRSILQDPPAKPSPVGENESTLSKTTLSTPRTTRSRAKRDIPIPKFDFGDLQDEYEIAPEKVFEQTVKQSDQYNNHTKLVDASTQTDGSIFEGRCDQCLAKMNALVGGYKPMYSIPKQAGKIPPLKLGLTLPKGRKRKVFYPDEEKEIAKGC